MPGSADRRSELLARALEQGATPPADEQLRHELAMVGRLVAIGQQVRPDAAARERMRERVLAGFPAVAAEAVPDGARVVAIGRGRRRFPVAGVQGRLLVAAAAALCLVMSLSGMSLVLARDALPGDALYGVKRSAESAELGITFGDESRGFKHLEFATARVNEVEALAARADGPRPTGDPASYLTALQAFDTDAAAGSRLLIQTATNGGGDELTTLSAWAEQQRLRLDSALATMPERAAARTGGSIALLDRVSARAAALQARLSCLEVTTGARDDVGLLPADGPCVPAAGPSGGVAPSERGDQDGTPEAPHPSVVLPGQPTDADLPGGPIGPLHPGPTSPLPSTPGDATDSSGPSGSPSAEEPPPITVPLPIPLPPIGVPPLLPGLPGLHIG